MSSQVQITAEDRGPLVDVVAWVAMTFMCLAVLTKLGTKLSIVHRLELDDLIIAASTAFAIGQTVAISFEAKNGLGRHITTLDSLQIEHLQQADYASQLLYIPALCLAKVATVMFLIRKATVSNRARLAGKALCAVIAIWTLVAILAVAFQCNLPESWIFVSSHCFNRAAFWDVFVVFDILTDIAVIGLPIWSLYDLQVPWRKKVKVIGAFSSRLLVIPLSILRIYYLTSALDASDPTFEFYRPVLTTSIQTNLGIIVACLPFFRPFIESLESGLLTSDLRLLAPTFSTGGSVISHHGSAAHELEHSTQKPKSLETINSG